MHTINIGQILANREFLTPELEAYKGQNYLFNYKEANIRANSFTKYLISKGFKKGDCIAVLGKNNEHIITSLFGAAKIGIVTVILNWRLQTNELKFILHDSNFKLMVYDEEFSDAAQALADESKNLLIIKYSQNQDNQFEQVINANLTAENMSIGGNDDPAVIMYTSGTTGNPKGATLSHNNLFWASIGIAYTIHLNFKYRFLSVAPIFHIGGLAPIMTNVHSGITTIFMPNFDPSKVWEIIASEKINWMMSVPQMLQFMLLYKDIDRLDLKSLKFIVCGGSPVPKEIITSYFSKNIKVYHVYGISEYTGAVTFWMNDMGLDNYSAGKPVLHGNVKIIKPETEEILPPGEIGEICCFGPQVFSGYWNNEEATHEVKKNDYYRTGDLGKIDEHGFVYVVDRLKDMIISGGENIYPAEIEAVIKKFQGISEVAVVGKNDSKWGEIPVAVVVKSQNSNITEDDIINFCKSNLAKYKCVKEVHFVDSIPKNAVGKELKKELRKMVNKQ